MFMIPKSNVQETHFEVDPLFVVDLARQRYWFEDKKQSGVEMLRCFIGIEPYQITRILEGNATVLLNGEYREYPDDYFKKYLKDFLEFRKRSDSQMWFGGCKVDRDVINKYVNHITRRVLESQRNTKHGIMFDKSDINEIMGLEIIRQELHDRVLKSAGFGRNDNDSDACDFRLALDEYVEQKVKDALKSPLEDFTENEIVEKRRQSDKYKEYMEMEINA